MEDFTHFDRRGRARMVDVGEKEPTRRTAVAGARVFVNRETFALIRSGGTNCWICAERWPGTSDTCSLTGRTRCPRR